MESIDKKQNPDSIKLEATHSTLDLVSQDSKVSSLESTQDSTQKATQESQKPRLSAVVSGANELSLGISIVVAVALGIGIGIGLEYLSGARWSFWLGVAWGIGAAILNIYKAYQRQQRDAQELAKNPRYAYKPQDSKKAQNDDDEDENGKYY
ncbi:hypothetical protein Hc94105_1584 [Helicobacter cinaedi]|uniref:AtpZ/AtpI family protein n=1 Tax=Helicobacter cinaedi TaxID=213 RepID=UPI001F2F95FF|nr:AtpZ/AtpI family protein [Helicobacter cinaedi]BDB67362.1 hypothetical protein Hc94105_1584 [Helicobacter cinaedi]